MKWGWGKGRGGELWGLFGIGWKRKEGGGFILVRSFLVGGWMDLRWGCVGFIDVFYL